MNKAVYIKEITETLNLFDAVKLKEIDRFVKYMKSQDLIDPTLEILADKEWYDAVKKGLEEKALGETVDWDSIQ